MTVQQGELRGPAGLRVRSPARVRKVIQVGPRARRVAQSQAVRWRRGRAWHVPDVLLGRHVSPGRATGGGRHQRRESERGESHRNQGTAARSRDRLGGQRREGHGKDTRLRTVPEKRNSWGTSGP